MRTFAKHSLMLLVALGGLSGLAHAQDQAQGRVISSTPIVQDVPTAHGLARQTVGYQVTYEFDGRRYTTQTAEPPGATLPLQVNALGVTMASTPGAESPSQAPAPWQNVVPEPGIVVPSGSGPASAYAASNVPPAYPVPVEVVPASPAYGYGYGYDYGYAAPSYAPWVIAAPIGWSLNLGYTRGWGRGHGHGYRGHRGWRR